MGVLDDAALNVIVREPTVGHTTEPWHVIVFLVVLAAAVFYLEHESAKKHAKKLSS